MYVVYVTDIGRFRNENQMYTNKTPHRLGFPGNLVTFDGQCSMLR